MRRLGSKKGLVRADTNGGWYNGLSNFVPTNDHFTSIMACFVICRGYAWTKSGHSYVLRGYGYPQIGISREFTNNPDNILTGWSINANYDIVSPVGYSGSMSFSSPYAASGGFTVGLGGGLSVTQGTSVGTLQGNVTSAANGFSAWVSQSAQGMADWENWTPPD